MACNLHVQLTCDYPGLYLHITVIHLNAARQHAWRSLAHVLEWCA